MSEETEKTPDQKNSRWALPHVFVLLFGIIVFAAIMTWILPAGDFNRVTNSACPGRYLSPCQSSSGRFF